MLQIVEIQTELRGQFYWISVVVRSPCPLETMEVVMELGVPSQAGRSAKMTGITIIAEALNCSLRAGCMLLGGCEIRYTRYVLWCCVQLYCSSWFRSRSSSKLGG